MPKLVASFVRNSYCRSGTINNGGGGQPGVHLANTQVVHNSSMYTHAPGAGNEGQPVIGRSPHHHHHASALSPVSQPHHQFHPAETRQDVMKTVEEKLSHKADLNRISVEFLLNGKKEQGEQEKGEQEKQAEMSRHSGYELSPVKQLPSPELSLSPTDTLGPQFNQLSIRGPKGKAPDYGYQQQGAVSPRSPYACQPSPPMSHNSSPVGIAPVSSPDPYAPHYQTHQVQPRQVSPYQVPHQHQMVPPQYQMPPHQMQMPPQMQPMHTLTRAPLPHHQADVREIPIDLHQRHSAHYAQPSRIHPYMQHPTMHQMVHGQESVMAFHTSVNVPQERYVFAPLNTGNMTHPYPPSYYPEEAPQKQDGVMNFYHGKRSRGPANRWQPEEDELLKKAVEKWGDERQWVKVSKMVPGRTNLQCRQRWLCNLKGKIMAAKLKAEAAEKNAALLAAATATANAAAVASSSKVAEPAAETMAVDGAEQDDQDKEME